MSNNTDSSPSLELIAARLAYAGATITTIGDYYQRFQLESH